MCPWSEMVGSMYSRSDKLYIAASCLELLDVLVICPCVVLGCDTTQFTCGNGNCISSSLVNNSVNDCGDNYDEGRCTQILE